MSAFDTVVWLFLMANGLLSSVVLAGVLLWLSNQPKRIRAIAEYQRNVARTARHRSDRRHVGDPNRFAWLPQWSSAGFGGAS